jgi:hypothetical protein
MLVLLVVLLAADSEPAERVKPLAKGPWTHPKYTFEKNKATTVARVIRTPRQLVSATPHELRSVGPEVARADATRELLTSLKAKEIDWTKHMVVAVIGWQQPAGSSVEITGVTKEKDVLTVKWRLRKPKAAAPGAIAFPSQCVLLPRFAGKVVFDPPPGK